MKATTGSAWVAWALAGFAFSGCSYVGYNTDPYFDTPYAWESQPLGPFATVGEVQKSGVLETLTYPTAEDHAP